MLIIFMVIKFKVSLILAFTIFRYNLCFVAVTYVSKTWITKQLLPDLQAVCAVTFSGRNFVGILTVNA